VLRPSLDNNEEIPSSLLNRLVMPSSLFGGLQIQHINRGHPHLELDSAQTLNIGPPARFSGAWLRYMAIGLTFRLRMLNTTAPDRFSDSFNCTASTWNLESVITGWLQVSLGATVDKERQSVKFSLTSPTLFFSGPQQHPLSRHLLVSIEVYHCKSQWLAQRQDGYGK